jgi:hypothetical protein
VGFEPTIAVLERAKTVRALDRSATAIGQKVNEELFLDNPLHVILNKSKLAYRIYVILIANKGLIKNKKTLVWD